METLSEILSERIYEHQMQASEREPIRSTTGTRAAIGLLAARVDALEATIEELTNVIQGLTRSQSEDGEPGLQASFGR